MNKFRIIMNSEAPYNTTVLSPNGEDVSSCVRRITIEHRAGSIPTATMEVLTQLDVTLGAEVVGGNPIAQRVVRGE